MSKRPWRGDIQRVGGVDVVHFNPARWKNRNRRLQWRRRSQNFGDLLGPVIVREMVARNGLRARPVRPAPQLLAVGSILRLARDGDVLWGIGVNGKTMAEPFDFTRLDVRAVRGPLTRQILLANGVDAPTVYGDPGLLVGHLWTAEALRGSVPRRGVTIIPNLNDLARYDPDDPRVVIPTAPLAGVLAAIAASEFVTGSSLHGIVVAESLGIPARVMRSGGEPLFKYDDYYRGSGRDAFDPADSVVDAIARGGEPPARADIAGLLAAFPADLWQGAD